MYNVATVSDLLWLSFPIGHLKLLPSRTKQIINVSGIIVLMETALNKDFFFLLEEKYYQSLLYLSRLLDLSLYRREW